MQGNIARVCYNKGYFFVTDGDKSVFAHYTQLRDANIDDIYTGDICQYEVGTSEKGPVALDVFVEPVCDGERMEGEIDSFSGSFGFIRVEGSDERVFFHVSAVNFFVNPECVGMLVSFVPADSDRGGMEALRVKAV